MQIKLRNRLHRVENIKGATVQFTAGATGAATLTVTTDALGLATLDLSKLPPGTYTCVITAPETFAGPVGPALVSVGAVPNRVYRPVTLSVVRTASGFGSVTPTNRQYATVTVAANLITVDIQPVWMRSTANSHRGDSISMIVVHHTACALGPAVATFLAQKGPHYMIDTDGQIVKWVQDARAAWHAGVARWAGESNINSCSIGIEIVHVNSAYLPAQYPALLDLLDRIQTAFPDIDPWNIVGHSDVGTNASGWLGRKSGDPGPHFEWRRLEDQGLGLLPIVGPPAPNFYGGFFQAVPNGSLRRGDDDKHHRFGGSTHKTITGTPVQELQEDLAAIGYSVGTPDGDFGERSHHAVIAFQEHFFAGGRGHKNPDGRVDIVTAAWIKSVADNAP